MLRKLALINFYSKEVMKMWRDSEQILDSVFLSYDKILKRLKLLMDENNEIYKEMRVKPPEIFNDFEKWHDYVKKTSNLQMEK